MLGDYDIVEVTAERVFSERFQSSKQKSEYHGRVHSSKYRCTSASRRDRP